MVSTIFDFASSDASNNLIASNVAEGVWKLSANWQACFFQSSNLRGRRCLEEEEEDAEAMGERNEEGKEEGRQGWGKEKTRKKRKQDEAQVEEGKNQRRVFSRKIGTKKDFGARKGNKTKGKREKERNQDDVDANKKVQNGTEPTGRTGFAWDEGRKA